MNLWEFADILTRMRTYALTRCVDILFECIDYGEITFYAENARTNMRKTLIVTHQTFYCVKLPCKYLENRLKNMIDEASI